MKNTDQVAEAIVDAVGEALGVDTGTCSEVVFAAAVAAAKAVLAKAEADQS